MADGDDMVESTTKILWLVSGLGAAGAVTGAVLYVNGTFDQTKAAPETVQPVAMAPAEATPETAETAESEPETDIAPVEEAAPAEDVAAAAPDETPEPAPEPEAILPTPPSFDVVRVEADGLSLVAGRGEPRKEINVLLNQEVVENTATDRDGRFVVFVSLPASDVPRVLSLRMMVDGVAVYSEEEVILAPTPVPAPAPEIAEAVPESAVEAETPDVVAMAAPSATAPAVIVPNTTEVAEGTEDAAPEATVDTALAAIAPDTSDAPVTTVAPGTSAAPAASAVSDATPDAAVTALATPVVQDAQPDGLEPQAAPIPDVQQGASVPASVAASDSDVTVPSAVAGVTTGTTVLISRPEGVEVLQAPGSVAPGPQVTTELALDSITYDSEGEVALAGRGAGEGFVRVYLDNTPIATSRVSADGRWRTELPEVDTGVYTLRVDRLDEEGTVVARVESPFKREDPLVLAASDVNAGADTPIRAITVQPGNTLWAIARDRYGEGMAYVRVFDANRDRIRDADLIYPGQVFDLPD